MNSRAPLAGPLRWAFVMNWGQRGVSTTATFVLAALLGPHNFGLVAIAGVYVAFVQVFLEQGIGAAVIQRERLEREHLDSAFWMNLAWGLALTAVSVALAGWWARMNGLPAVEPVIQILSILLPISALTVVQQAVLQRNLKFKKLAVRSNVSALVGGICGIATALGGVGVWALVIQQLVTAFVGLILLWSVSQWTPRMRFSYSHARELLGFSVHAFLGNLGVFVNRRADALFMGIFFGPVAVGLYRLADRLVETVATISTRPVHIVSFPHFSRLQSDAEGLQNSVKTCMRITLIATFPTMLVLIASSDSAMAALGPEWATAADPLKLLSLVGIGKALFLFTGPLLFAVDRPRLRTVVIWGLAALSTAALIFVGLTFRDDGTRDQVVAVAFSRVIVFVGFFVPISAILIWRISGVSPRMLLPFVPVPVAAGLAAISAGLGLKKTGVTGGLPPVMELAAVGGISIAAALTVLLILEPGVRGQARALVGGVARRAFAAGV